VLIETAFFTLTELLTSGTAQAAISEESVRHHMAVAVQMALASRSIDRPYDHVRTEKPYDLQAPGPYQLKADLHLDVRGALDVSRLHSYGEREQSWLEIKALFKRGRSSSYPRTQTAGKLVRDLLRICCLPAYSGEVDHPFRAKPSAPSGGVRGAG